MKKFNLTWFLLALALIACNNQVDMQEKESKETAKSMNEEKMEKLLAYSDQHSFSNPNEAVVTHLNWVAKVDFGKKIIEATATYQIENKKNVDTIFLDVRNLNIKEVRRDDIDGAIGFKLQQSKSIDTENFLGSSLAIPISNKTKTISIVYSTTEGADALQFLDPNQTSGKTAPFLFTQSQAILARTWIPCQDSPGIRFTYEAEVEVPKGMLALMSADNPTSKNETGIYKFKMDQAIPSYLFALAVGDLEYKSLGEVCGVYAEPSVLESAAYEFEEMQNMVDTAESLYGPYQWGRYDVIVLPPSFPFGGMENPRLTFATPTIIAGDRSLTALVAHELAHSWSGNLVTNATWEDIWLNEGFTVYFENRIMEEIYGKDFSDMLALLSYEDLIEEIKWLNSENRAADTRLKVDLKGRNPDDGLTGIPYDKGYFLLRLIEETVGRENWDSFLKEYFETFSFKIMTTDGFLYYINQKLLNNDSTWADKIKIEDWVFGEGLPDNCPKIISKNFENVETAVNNWKDGAKPKSLKTNKWMTPEWLYFINQLPTTLNEEQMKSLDEAFNFTISGNSEIQAAWFEKVIPNNYSFSDSAVEAFLIRVGRRKFLVPIYKSILKSDNGSLKANKIYEKARPNYHAVSRITIDGILGFK